MCQGSPCVKIQLQPFAANIGFFDHHGSLVLQLPDLL